MARPVLISCKLIVSGIRPLMITQLIRQRLLQTTRTTWQVRAACVHFSRNGVSDVGNFTLTIYHQVEAAAFIAEGMLCHQAHGVTIDKSVDSGTAGRPIP